MTPHSVDNRIDRPLRIAFFVDVFPRISNTFILNQITGLIDHGHEVDIFATSVRGLEDGHEQVRSYGLEQRMRHLELPRNPLQRTVVAATHLAKPRNWTATTLDSFSLRRHGKRALNLGQLFTVLSFRRSSGYDVVHAQFGQLGNSLLPLARSGELGAPLVVSFRGADISSAVTTDPMRYSELLGTANLFLPVSELFAGRLRKLGAPPRRVEVLHSGVDVKRFPFRERRLLPGETARLLFVGRLAEKKGISYALEALAGALRAGRDLELTVVGEGELENQARRLAEHLGIGTRVRWLGRRPTEAVARILAESHLLIAPSVTARDGDQEGIPNTLKEAMAAGMPVLSTVHSGIPELVDDGVSGFLVPERDSGALTHRLIELLDNPGQWPAMGRAGRRKVETDFDIDPLNERLIALYYRLLATDAAGTNPTALSKPSGL